jgi:hypothetical protein
MVSGTSQIRDNLNLYHLSNALRVVAGTIKVLLPSLPEEAYQEAFKYEEKKLDRNQA